jgi:hypothetical protein
MDSRPDAQRLTTYLLGGCSEAEQEQIEQAFFADDDLFDRLCAVEEDLTGRYARGELGDEERRAFEAAHGAGPRRERLLLNLALHRAASAGLQSAERTPTPVAVAQPFWRRWVRLEPPGARMVLAAATVMLAVALGSVWSRDRARQSALDVARHQAEAERQQAAAAAQRATEWEQRASALADQMARAQAARPETPTAPRLAPVVAAFVLTPGLSRGTRGPARVALPQSVDQVRFQLDLESDAYPNYRAEIRTSSQDVIWSEDGLSRRGSTTAPHVTLSVPAALLTAGDHEVVLRGRTAAGVVEELASYYVTVIRR